MEKRFKKLLNLEPDIQEGEEEQMADNPRNWLADKINPVVEEYVNAVLPESLQFAIPKMSVADEKRYQANLPEMMAGATMGSISRFGKILPNKGFGKVTVVPSAADKLADAQKAAMMKNVAQKRFQKEYIDTGISKQQKESMNPEEFSSWATDVLNKLMRGE